MLSGTSGSLLQLRYWLKHDYCFFNGVQRRRHWYNLFLLRRISWLNGRNRFSDGPSAILTGLCSWSKGKPVMALYFGIRMVHSWWLVMDSCWLLRTQRLLGSTPMWPCLPQGERNPLLSSAIFSSHVCWLNLRNKCSF